MSNVNLMLGDCIDKMQELSDGSVDAIITDPPYGTTACKWDVIIPLDRMWEQFERVIRPDGAIVLFSSQPFTTALISSRMSLYRYSWIWKKEKGSNFQLANIQPLKLTEDICVFSKARSANGAHPCLRYFPILEEREKPARGGGGMKTISLLHKSSMKPLNKTYYTHHPTNILEFNKLHGPDKVHPAQKPAALLQYLVETYTLENETVLDATMGSGTTGVACVNANRRFIGIEKDPKYFCIAKNRIEKAVNTPKQSELGI